MKKGNLLFVSAHLPSMNVPQAGQKIAYQLLKQYAELYHVYVVSFYNEVEKEQAQTGELDFCEQTHLFEVTRARRILSAVTNVHMPLRAAVRVNRAAITLIAELQRTVRFDVAHFEFTSAAFYLSVFNQLEGLYVGTDVGVYKLTGSVGCEIERTFDFLQEGKRVRAGGRPYFKVNLGYTR